jgi:type I restriction-modification system DNA methylase subunit/restriction endonuclease S subunit
MSKQYTCDLCKKTFNQKIDYTRHKNKKTSCITIDEMEKITKIKEIKTDNNNKLINLFKNCLNILRDNEGLTGEKALRTLSYLLILKLIEPHIGKDIDIDNYKYDFSHIQDDMVENHKKKLLEIVRFSNLCKEKEDNIPIKMKYLWEDILSNHPMTKNIFLKGKNFDIQYKSTYKNIINQLSIIDFTKIEYDILGNAYEEICKDIMVGKVLGQFFTQPLVKKMMVKLINPQIHPDGKIESCGDPTMGTGGFLITYLQNIITQAKNKNIKPDWEYIRNEGLYGREIDPDTYQLAVSNMLISSGHIIDSLERGDSIRSPITRKFDNILANPPFGIKGLRYDDFNYELKDQYIPIKSDNAVSLFIQAIIYMLKINGKCAIVLPDGQDLFSKTNTTLVFIREYLMKTCDLKEIIYLPTGIFTYTSIKTCVFYFIKKREGIDVLETKINISKSKKETSRDYKFSKTHQTTKVKFYDFNPYEDIKNLLVEVPIDKIMNNSYSLNYTEYMKEEIEEEKYENDVIIKTLGEVCSIDYGTRIVKGNNTEGEYPVYGSGRPMFSTNTFNREGYNILIGRFALSLECVRFVNEKIFLNDSGLSIKPKTDILLHKYIGYFLLHNQSIIYNCARGTAQKNLEMDIFKSIKIQIPSLDCQQEIVKYLDFIYEKTIKTSNEKIAELKMLNKICLNNQEKYGDNVVKTLGEVCSIIKGEKKKSKDGKDNGLYPLYYCSILGNLYLDTFDYTGEGIIINKTNGSGKAMVYYGNNKYNVGETTIHFKSKNNELYTKYIYYFLFNNIELLEKYYKGANQKSIIEDDLFKIKIPFPSIECQKEIIKYCELNVMLTQQLEIEIENNKKQAQLFFTNIIKSKSTLENTNLDTELDNVLDKELEKDNIVIKNKLEIDDNQLTNSNKKTKTKGSLINIID